MQKTMAQTPLSEDVGVSISWIETSDTVSRHFFFQPDGQFSVKVLDDQDQLSTKWLNLSSTNSSPLVFHIASTKDTLDILNFGHYNTSQVQHYPFYQLSHCYMLQA